MGGRRVGGSVGGGGGREGGVEGMRGVGWVGGREE